MTLSLSSIDFAGKARTPLQTQVTCNCETSQVTSHYISETVVNGGTVPLFTLLIEISHLGRILIRLLKLGLGFIGIKNAVERIGHVRPAFVAELAGSDGRSAAFAVEHKRGILGNLETVVPEPLADLGGIDAARFGNLRNADTLMFPDVFLNLLELGFHRFPAIWADNRTGNIVEHLTAVLAIPDIHPMNLPSYTPLPDAMLRPYTLSAPALSKAREHSSIVEPVV